LVPRHVTEGDRDLALDVFAHHDVPSGLRGKQTEHVDDVRILEIEREELPAVRRRRHLALAGRGRLRRHIGGLGLREAGAREQYRPHDQQPRHPHPRHCMTSLSWSARSLGGGLRAPSEASLQDSIARANPAFEAEHWKVGDQSRTSFLSYSDSLLRHRMNVCYLPPGRSVTRVSRRPGGPLTANVTESAPMSVTCPVPRLSPGFRMYPMPPATSTRASRCCPLTIPTSLKECRSSPGCSFGNSTGVKGS